MSQPTFTTTIVFGDLASKRYAEGETDDAKLNEEGSVETFTFNSAAEQQAFLDGVDAANGWLDYAVKETTPVAQLADA